MLAAAFLLLVYGLLTLRLQSGGGHAPYSSFRTDPLGVRALYDALARTPGVQVLRHRDQYNRLSGGDGDTLYILGLEEWVLEPDDAKALEVFMSQGGRVVAAFHGRFSMPYRIEREERRKDRENAKEGKKKGAKEEKKETPPEPPKTAPAGENGDNYPFPPAAPPGDEPRKKSGDHDPEEADDADMPWADLEARWGFSFAYDEGSAKTLSATLAGERQDLPPRLPWRSVMWFKDARPAWRAVYRAGDRPVVMERDFGRGQMVLISDSYLFSNEALRRDRQAAFLAWTAGTDRHRLVFDEAHLGSIRQEGIMTLVRRYRLAGFLLAGLAAVALYIWRNATSLEPRRADGHDGDGAQAGLGSGAALTTLLRRSVPPALLPQTCWNEWLKSFRGGLGPDDPLTGRVEQLLASRPSGGRGGAEELVRQYRAVAAALAERKVHRGTRP